MSASSSVNAAVGILLELEQHTQSDWNCTHACRYWLGRRALLGACPESAAPCRPWQIYAPMFWETHHYRLGR